MSLIDLNYKISYRSDDDDLLEDFYIPTLTNSIEYKRSVGFFTNSILNELGKGIYPFINNNGNMKIICGVKLSEEDQEEIEEGYSIKKTILENKIKDSLSFCVDEALKIYLDSDLSNICWMIANNRLEIKIAVRIFHGKLNYGIYHEKICVCKDEYNNFIATNGSANETKYGYVYNFEHFDLFKSWGSEDELKRVNEKINYFDKMWNNTTNNLAVFEFPEAVKEKLIIHAPSMPFTNKTNSNYMVSNEVIKEDDIKPWDYQIDAINAWFKNGYTGILEMATGTGKTFTSLFAVKKYLTNVVKKNILIICVPYQHLVSQWEDNVKTIFPEAHIVKCFKNKKLWYQPLNILFQEVIYGDNDFGIVITTTSTGSSDDFTDIVNTNKIDKVVICDEVHNIGSEYNKNFLKINAIARIGLSATPIRPYDEEGNRAINEYFGKTVYKLGIKEAINMEFLIKYNYDVSFCELDEFEYEEYKNISIQIAQLYKKGSCVNEYKLQKLLLKRARIISSCNSKLKGFNEILDRIYDFNNLLVYTAEDPTFFIKTQKILETRNISALKITSSIKNEKRKEIIDMFSDEDISCILAMRCLDEGVDIPTANKAIILASSTNSKQYIQRRGRVLRKDKNGIKKVANIYDVIIIPPQFESEIDKNLFERELERVLEFASTARNGLQTISKLIDFAKQNALLKNFINIFKGYEL